jgi:Cysteine-rich secretory protein family
MTVRQGPPSRRAGGARSWLLIVVTIGLFVLPCVGVAPRTAAAAVQDDDGTTGGLARINEARAAIGVPPLKRNAALDSSATAHANYYKLNFGDPALAGNGMH